MEIVDVKGDLPEVEIRCGDMVEVRGLLLFDQFFEDADIFDLRNFDSEGSIGVIAENKAIEREKWRKIKSYGHFG
jgi:hypothetical protein